MAPVTNLLDLEKLSVKLRTATFIAIIAGVCSSTWAAYNVLAQMKALKVDHFGIAAASEQAFRMAIENPGMRVPDPREPSRIIVVEHGHVDKASNVRDK